jgi:hypothetical protein
MKTWTILALSVLLIAKFASWAQIPVLKRSDVVFMYQAGRQTYEDYGATVIAWGGTPNAQSLAAAKGLKFFGSVGMVTEFSRYHDRFPQTYEQGLCRDVHGQPFKVPWLTDHQHKGVPYWWCCTRQSLFRQYLSERVIETVQAGADGVHIDDHLGTAGALGSGGCFCDRCVGEFPDYLKHLPQDELDRLGVPVPAQFNYCNVLRDWMVQKSGRQVQQHPLWRHWRIYQLRDAAKFMKELRALAARTAGRAVPMSANAGLLWGPHLNDYQTLDFFSAEIDHHASQRQFNDTPLVAYRLADAVGRPLASTASGGDWAFIKEQNLPGLVQGWIALSYAAGHCLMAPNRQWCYTPQKGTHWYEGPKDKFAPLGQFVRQHAVLFDDYENHADLTVAFSQRTFDRDARKVMGICNKLADANISYRLALGGDEVVDHPLPVADLCRAAPVLVIEPTDFSPADQSVLATVESQRRCENVEQALTRVVPAVRVEAPGVLRVLPRVKPGAVVIHLVNRTYDAARDGVQPVKNARLRLNLKELGVPHATEARLFSPGNLPVTLPVQEATVTLPELGLWAVMELKNNAL